MLRAEFLAQTHLHTRGGLRHRGVFRERAKLDSCRFPGILQRGAMRTSGGVFPRSGALRFAQRSVPLGVQSNGFEFFALHLLLSSHEKIFHRATLALRGTPRSISSLAISKAFPRCSRERMVPMGHPAICAASS